MQHLHKEGCEREDICGYPATNLISEGMLDCTSISSC